MRRGRRTSGRTSTGPSAEDRRAELLDRLAAGPVRIAEAARRAAACEAAAGPTDGWTARQQVAHLALVEQVVFQPRLDQLAGGEPPAWAWTEPGTSDAPDVATLEAAARTLAAQRAETLARVRRLDEAGWRRYGIHATFGRLDVAGLLGVIANHDDEHRSDLEDRA